MNLLYFLFFVFNLDTNSFHTLSTNPNPKAYPTACLGMSSRHHGHALVCTQKARICFSASPNIPRLITYRYCFEPYRIS